MNDKKYIIGGGLLLLAVVAVGVWFFLGRDDAMEEETVGSGVEGEPIDVAIDFYTAWLKATESTSTDPYTAGLTQSPSISQEVSSSLGQERSDTDMDPVLCRTDVPEVVRARPVFITEDGAQILIMPRGEGVGEALFTLAKKELGWLITDITCTLGETAAEGEFSFEREGWLLKDVPAPLDPQYWHLVFEENGAMGHTVPLFFNAESSCSSLDGTESTCDPEQFTQAAKAFVQGDMTESGLNVRHLRLIE